jgi:HlyD family secretion protein
MTGTEILRVANLNNMEEVDVNENDIVKIKVGDAAKVEVDAYLKNNLKVPLPVFLILLVQL